MLFIKVIIRIKFIDLDMMKHMKTTQQNLYVSACVRHFWDNPNRYTYLSVHECIS